MMAFQAFFQQNMQFVVAIGGSCLYLGSVYPHLWGVEKYRKMMEMHKNGKPVELTEDLKNIGQEILDKMLLQPYVEATINFFMVYGQDLVNKGSTSSRKGAVIGIPINFTYTSIDKVQKENITLNNKPIAWDTPAGQSLLDSLILSRKAHRFGIARELMTTNHQLVHARGILLMTCCYFSYTAGYAMNRLYNLQKRLKMPARLVMYSVFANIGMMSYFLLSDKLNWYKESKADRKAGELGREYAEGGVELYQKFLQRNVAMRSLMGEEGGKKYTVYGNEVHYWRSPHVPLTVRRDNLKEILKTKYTMNSENSENSMLDSEPIEQIS
ncbi:transmembrane protein 177-like [Gigantopelta aegis]|uniref:transmembrane protein 177-like n=1 Tax=Gigantopelta aegis TaxID=1735272 RepID=UPI001B887762|nr:transmembrane protein 177-like [Gigantopelta aegis]